MKLRALLPLTPMVFFLLSSALYFLPYPLSSLGWVADAVSPRIRIDYSAETGFVVIWALLACVVGIVFYPRNYQHLEIKKRNRWESTALSIMLVVLGMYTALTPEIYLDTKADVLEATNRFHLLFYAICSIGFVYSFMVGWKTEYVNLALSSLGLAFVMFIGHRSALALALLGVFYISFRNRSITQVRLRYVALGILLLLFLAIYKSLYRSIKTGMYDRVADALAVDQIASSMIVGLEQFVIFLHLDYVVSTGFEAECSNMWLIPVSLIPFADELVDSTSCTFTDQVQPVFFAEFSGGVGANIWAEFYSHLGIIGIPVLVLTIALFALAFEWAINKFSSALLKTSFILALMHMTFYIQRKELFGAFISAKRVVITALIVFVLAKLLKLLFARRASARLHHPPPRAVRGPHEGLPVKRS